MYKPLADSTLMNMTKKEIIEHLRVAEHNHKVCEEQIDQQYKNTLELLKKERAGAIDEFSKKVKELRYNISKGSDDFYRIQAFCDRDIDEIAEQLKEQKQ